eukprot:3190836-Rhodomonas_salina.1
MQLPLLPLTMWFTFGGAPGLVQLVQAILLLGLQMQSRPLLPMKLPHPLGLLLVHCLQMVLSSAGQQRHQFTTMDSMQQQRMIMMLYVF